MSGQCWQPKTPLTKIEHDRNQRMVDLAEPGDVCLAFPSADSRGTWDCVRRAKERGLRVIEAKVPGR